MTKKPGPVWTYYNKKIDGTQTIAFCKYCNQSYIQNATRMEKHLVKCAKCPESVKATFAKHRKDAPGARVRKSTVWIDQKMNSNEGGNEWDEAYETENVNFEIAEDMEMGLDTETTVQNVVSEMNNGAAGWEPVNINRNKSPSRSVMESQTRASTSQERPAISHPRRSTLPRRISQWPGFSTRPVGHSPLQSKILQEQLLERRTWRRVAELELQKKNLEYERLQWEYERDKMQSEMKLNHESRMMEFREEREKQILEREMADG